MNFFNKYITTNATFINLIEFATAVVCTVLLALFINFLLKKLYQRLLNTQNYWDDAIVKALQKPVFFIIIIAGINFAIDTFDVFLKNDNQEIFHVFYYLSCIIALGWFSLEIIHQLDRYFHQYKKIDLTTASALNKLLKITLLIFLGSLVMQAFGFNIAALAAFLGGGGLAVGFSAKDMIANFFGALTIYLDRPFKVGDWVRSPEKEIEGRVEDIGLRITIIRTFDKRPIYVPNSLFSTIVIENASRMTHRRINETITVCHADHVKLDKLSEEVIEAMSKNPYVDHKEDIVFNLTSLSTLGAIMLFTVYTKEREYKEFHVAKHHIMAKLIKMIEKNGIKMVEYQPSIKDE